MKALAYLKERWDHLWRRCPYDPTTRPATRDELAELRAVTENIERALEMRLFTQAKHVRETLDSIVNRLNLIDDNLMHHGDDITRLRDASPAWEELQPELPSLQDRLTNVERRLADLENPLAAPSLVRGGTQKPPCSVSGSPE